MKQLWVRPAVVVGAIGGLVGALVAMGPSARPVQAQVLSGFDAFRTNCVGCHELPDPEERKRTRKEWDAVLTDMVKNRGATLSTQEFTAVLNYLDSFNRPKREIQWIEAAAKSRTLKLTPADAGKLPAEWVDLTVGADETVPWAVQADPTGKTIYLSPLKAVGENQFPLLIDNSGLVRNGSVQARLQIVSGKGAVGAGVVFGFRNAQSYYGVRVGPRDIVLYEMQGGQRALLGRAPASAPLKQWHVLKVDVAGKNVKVSLNGQPVAALDRSLQAYQGGRFGLQTQGDTVALFDQWQVTVQ